MREITRPGLAPRVLRGEQEAKPSKRGVGGCEQSNRGTKPVVGSGGQPGADSDLSGLQGWGPPQTNSLFVTSLETGPRALVAPSTVRGDAPRALGPR